MSSSENKVLGQSNNGDSNAVTPIIDANGHNNEQWRGTMQVLRNAPGAIWEKVYADAKDITELPWYRESLDPEVATAFAEHKISAKVPLMQKK